MWDTAEGERVLTGAERHAVCETAGELVDAIRAAKLDDDSASLGILLFDRLIWHEQLAMLLKVLSPLLDPEIPPPLRTALMDATVAAIYAQMQNGVEYEIDMQQDSIESEAGDTARRREIVAALKEHQPEENWLDAECVVFEEWELAVLALRDLVLPDEDWNLGDMTLDMSPDKAGTLKHTMGIRREYFTDVPPDTNARSAGTVWADTLELINGRRPDETVFDLHEE